MMVLGRDPDVPLYEYQCEKCGKHVEKIETYKGPHLKKCPTCGGRVERLMSAPAIQFKGSGWYVTDYARGSSAGSKEKSESGNTGEKSDGKSDKSESKTESKTETKASSDGKEKKKANKEK
jgi:putative FmdB family regulatory protein